jgi:hypothetical protein
MSTGMESECMDAGLSTLEQLEGPPFEFESSLLSSDQPAQFGEISSFSEIEQYAPLSRDLPRNSNQDRSLYQDDVTATSVGYGISLASTTPLSTHEDHLHTTVANEDLLKGILKA